MKLDLQRRIAAKILKVGESRVWMDPDSAEEISKAITKEDIRGLIAQGLIKAKPKVGVSRARAKMLKSQRKRGRRKGHGSRKGAEKARTNKKRKWINRIRPLRRVLKSLKASGKLSSQVYRSLYSKAKGNFFRSTAHLKSYIEKLKRE
ncbi:MAG: 50S ribosomal protein L19e [Nanoarchaeota archaeon]|nr:50S ribosomal protein L19e [Nanoarchaeota archaeon]